MPADDLPFVAPGAPVSRSGSVLLGSVCADRSLTVAATHSADHARTGLRCASCSDDCGGTTGNIDGRAPSPIPLTCTGDWSFWHRMYSGGGRRIALSNDARPGREDEKRDQMSTRAERSAISRGRGDIPALEKAHQPHKPRHRGFTYPGNDVDRCGFSHWHARQFAAPLLFSGEA